MRVNTYGGESPSKTLTRNCLWDEIQHRLGLHFSHGSHLVLCGPDAGDVRQLLARGVGEIVAVDRDPQTLVSAMVKVKKLHPDAAVYYQCCDVLSCEGSFESIFLDWCGTITAKRLGQSFELAGRVVVKNGLLALGFSYNRDGHKPPKNVPSAEHRMNLVLQYVRKNKLPFKLMRAWSYFAASEAGGGTCMLYLLFKRGGGKHTHCSPQAVKMSEGQREQRIRMMRECAKSDEDLIEISDLWMVNPNSVPAWKAQQTRQRKQLHSPSPYFVDKLTEKQLKVYNLLSAGRTQREVGGLLGISQPCVAQHWRKIKRQMFQ